MKFETIWHDIMSYHDVLSSIVLWSYLNIMEYNNYVKNKNNNFDIINKYTY